MKNYRSPLAAILLLVMTPLTAAAHPGHGHPELQQTPVHFISEPVHAVMWLGLLLVAATCAALAYAGRLPRWR